MIIVKSIGKTYNMDIEFLRYLLPVLQKEMKNSSAKSILQIIDNTTYVRVSLRIKSLVQTSTFIKSRVLNEKDLAVKDAIAFLNSEGFQVTRKIESNDDIIL